LFFVDAKDPENDGKNVPPIFVLLTSQAGGSLIRREALDDQ
jgi:hypothetical protein